MKSDKGKKFDKKMVLDKGKTFDKKMNLDRGTKSGGRIKPEKGMNPEKEPSPGKRNKPDGGKGRSKQSEHLVQQEYLQQPKSPKRPKQPEHLQQPERPEGGREFYKGSWKITVYFCIILYAWVFISCEEKSTHMMILLFSTLAILCVSYILLTSLFKFIDRILVNFMMVFSAIGFCLQYRLDKEGQVMEKFMRGYAIAFICIIFTIYIISNFRFFTARWFIFPITLICMGGVAVVPFIAPTVGGTKNWLPGGFQVSEYIKIAIPFIAAYFLKDETGVTLTNKSNSVSAKHLVFLGIQVWLIFWMGVGIREFGTASVIAFVCVILFYIMNSNILWKIILASGSIAAATVLFTFFDTPKERLLITDPFGMGAKISGVEIFQRFFRNFSHSALFGTGWGKGSTAFLSVAKNDYVILCLTEEIGIFFVIFFMGMLVLFVDRIFSTGKMNDIYARFDSVLIIASASVIIITCIVCVGGNLNVMPLTGICLPFISYGTQAAISNGILMGIILGVKNKYSKRVFKSGSHTRTDKVQIDEDIWEEI